MLRALHDILKLWVLAVVTSHTSEEKATSPNYSRINIIKDVEFDNWGNTSNNVYAGLVWQGYYNSDAAGQSITLTQTVPENDQAQWLEGVSLCFYQTRETGQVFTLTAQGTPKPDAVLCTRDVMVSMARGTMVMRFLTTLLHTITMWLQGWRGKETTTSLLTII